MSAKTHQDHEQNELGQEPRESRPICESRPSTGTSPVVMLDDLSFAFHRLVEIILRFKAIFFVQLGLPQRIHHWHLLRHLSRLHLMVATTALMDRIKLIDQILQTDIQSLDSGKIEVTEQFCLIELC